MFSIQKIINFIHSNFYLSCILFAFDTARTDLASMIRFYFGGVYFYNLKVHRERHHSFHIVSYSAWPFSVSVSLFILITGLLGFLEGLGGQSYEWFVIGGLASLLWVVGNWWTDVITESLCEHTKDIKNNISLGMILFIVSEVMFFFSFFWAFFHVSLSPSLELGCLWPPKGLSSVVIDPFGIPLLNTLILLLSGVTVTCVHKAFISYSRGNLRLFNFYSLIGGLIVGKSVLKVLKTADRFWFKFLEEQQQVWYGWFERFYLVRWIQKRLGGGSKGLGDKLFEFALRWPSLGYNWGYIIIYFFVTLVLAGVFTGLQAYEYIVSPITIADGVYGSVFYLMTGFHGFHVLVGTIFLTVCFGRVLKHRFSFVRMVGLDCAIWYWHFVDVVWILLFAFVYVWGNGFIPNEPELVTLESYFLVDYEIVQRVLVGGDVVWADFAVEWQMGFQDSADILMELIVDLHDYIMFYLLIILGTVSWLLGSIIFDRVYYRIKKVEVGTSVVLTNMYGLRYVVWLIVRRIFVVGCQVVIYRGGREVGEIAKGAYRRLLI